MVNVYLAGGFARDGQIDWREEYHEAFKKDVKNGKVHFYDPHKKERSVDPDVSNLMGLDRNYWAWDKWAIQQSDIVIVFLERTNPGIGLYLELGYAHALGKTVIVVMEYSTGNEEVGILNRYREECKAFSDVFFTEKLSGLKFLKAFI